MYDGLNIVITTVRVSRSQFYIIYPNHQHPHPHQHQHQHQYQYQSNQYRHQYIHYLLYAHVHYYLGNVQKKKREIEQKIQNQKQNKHSITTNTIITYQDDPQQYITTSIHSQLTKHTNSSCFK